MAFKYSNEYKLYEKQSALDQRYYNQQQAQLNKWNQESAQKQMDFQLMMSNTAHQREVKDLIAAGLNPVLSANNGASTSSGAYANVDSTPVSAASQSRIANRQIASNMEMNRQSLANAYRIAKMQASINAAMQKYSTDMQYSLGLQQAQLSYDASIYGSDRSFQGVDTSSLRSLEGVKYGVDNPTSLSGSLIRVAQGLADTVLGGSSGRGNRDSRLGIRDTAKLLIKGIKNLASGTAVSLADRGFKTGDLGRVPNGLPISSNGYPMTSEQAKRIIIHNSKKSKTNQRAQALEKYGKKLLKEYNSYHK